MRVQLDLRPAEFLERERKRRSFNVVRLVALLLLFAFVFVNGFYIAMAVIDVQALDSDIETLEDEVSVLETSKTALMAEISRLKAKEAQFVKTLSIMQGEPPTLETLSAFETSLEPGMALSRVVFAPSSKENGVAVYSVTVDATAANEDEIIAFTDSLRNDGIFSSLAMPTTRRDEASGRVSFVLNLQARPFGAVASARQDK